MGTFSASGLISGIDSAAYIEQIMQLESIPVQRLQLRIQELDVQRTAYLDISARLLAVQNLASNFESASFFRNFASTSSNESVLRATASESANPGSYAFKVHRLVGTHSVVSRGFADTDSTPVGAGTLALEVGQGRVDRSTTLDALNGGGGVERGKIRINDRAGNEAVVDLTTALTVDDVLEAINAADVNVKASVTSVGDGGDRLVIEDTTAANQVTGNLSISDVNGRHAAADLGIAGTSVDGLLESHDLVYLTGNTKLSTLNDGVGVGRVGFGTDADIRFDAGADGSFNVSFGDVLSLDTDLRMLNNGNGARLGTIRITDRGGKSAEIDLSSAATARDVRDLILAADVDVSVTTVNGHFQITDTSGVAGDLKQNLVVEDVTGHAAADLGIEADVEADAVIGKDVYRISTIGDVIRAINYNMDNNGLVQADLAEDGNGIVLRKLGAFGEPISVTSLNGSTAARDLGIEDVVVENEFHSRDLLAGLNTVLLQSLNGGNGFDLGTVSFTDAVGQQASIDFSATQSLSEIVDLINNQTNLSLEARINDAGHGIAITDTSEGGGPLLISDSTGSLASQLGIAGTFTQQDIGADRTISSSNLQLRYVAHQTLLDDLNGGKGVSGGTIRISDSNGGITDVGISSSFTTVGQVISAINNAAQDRDGDGVKDIEARINDTGDGIAVIDHTSGEFDLTIEDTGGGSAAADLRLAGTASEGENFIDGSYEVRIDISASDTLEDVIRKIKESAVPISASIFNDRSGDNPYSLSLTSELSGLAGELMIDDGGLGLGFTTISRAQDALISVGGANPATPN